MNEQVDQQLWDILTFVFFVFFCWGPPSSGEKYWLFPLPSDIRPFLDQNSCPLYWDLSPEYLKGGGKHSFTSPLTTYKGLKTVSGSFISCSNTKNESIFALWGRFGFSEFSPQVLPTIWHCPQPESTGTDNFLVPHQKLRAKPWWHSWFKSQGKHSPTQGWLYHAILRQGSLLRINKISSKNINKIQIRS